MNHLNSFKNRRKKGKSFSIDHSEIEKAVNEYLKNGGKITKLEANDSNYIDYIKSGSSPFLVDEFLLGG